jgi:hypothetical protein
VFVAVLRCYTVFGHTVQGFALGPAPCGVAGRSMTMGDKESLSTGRIDTMQKVQVVLDEQKIECEKRYSFSKISEAVDSVFVDR